MKYVAHLTSDASDPSFSKQTEVAAIDIDGNIIYNSMPTETPRIWKSIHYPEWKNHVIKQAKKAADSGVDILAIDTWTLGFDVLTVVAFGETGSRDEADRPQNRRQLNGLLVEGSHKYGLGQFVYVKDDLGTKYLEGREAGIRQKVAGVLNDFGQKDLKTNASNNVAVIEYLNSEGSQVMHLINYDYDLNAQKFNRQNKIDFEVSLNRKLFGKEIGVYYLSPDWEGIKELNYTVRNNTAGFQVPELEAYGVVFIGEKGKSEDIGKQ